MHDIQVIPEVISREEPGEDIDLPAMTLQSPVRL